MQFIIRTWAVLNGFANQLVSALERRNPDALLALEKEKLRTLIGRFNDGLISHAVVVERLRSRVKRAEREISTIEMQTRALNAAGDQLGAGRLALRFKELTADLAESRIELDAADRAYRQLLESRDLTVRDARDRIERLRWQIGDLKVKRAMADLEGLASALIGGSGVPGESLNRLEELVSEERERAHARSRLAIPSVQNLPSLDARSRAMLEQEALREFLEQTPALAFPLAVAEDAKASMEAPASGTNQ
jgi:hypothetical protein